MYEDIPHLLTPVVVDPKLASNALRWAVREMEERYKTLATVGVRNIEQYNRNIKLAQTETKGPLTDSHGNEVRPLPFIVVLIDELADLMMVASNEVEESIARLAQMARAVGIHLILATQRPSVDVITGLIKANLPARISFRVSSKVDSRTILDGNGAEQLLGRGDMLYLPPASSRFVRLHGPYISEQESARLASFLRKQGKPTYDETITAEDKQGATELEFEKDDLYDEAARIVVSSGQASISYLQRRLRIGFSRAARLVDMMEAEGLVSRRRRRQSARGAGQEGLFRRSGRATAMTIEDPMQTISRLAAWLVVGAVLAGPGVPAAAGSARTLYTKVLNREQYLRVAENRPTLRELRNAVTAYQNVVRRYPTSGYSDNALWQGANLALLAYERFEDEADLRRGLRLLARLRQEYPFSPLKARAEELVRKFEAAAASPAPVSRPAAVVSTPAPAPSSSLDAVTIREIRRASLADGVVRVTIEMDGEALFRQERLDNPRRLFFDVRGARASDSLQDATLKFTDGVVRVIRLGRRPNNTTRVVMDMDGVESHSVFTLYNPYRVIVDFKGGVASPPAVSVATSGVSAPPLVPIVREKLELEPAVTPDVVAVPKPPATPLAPVPTVPSANLNGQFSLARQLGLGISRIVIDAGHGGHDPGARANGVNEAELVLDVAGRLRRCSKSSRPSK